MASSYSLGGHFENMVSELVQSGRYNNASEVLREGLRLLEDRELVRGIRVAEIRQLLQEADEEGMSDLSGEEFLDQLEAEYTAMLNPAHKE